MFKRIEDEGAEVRLMFEGREIVALKGETIAAALLTAGIHEFRGSYVTGKPRAPYCLMGACFECLVKVNGAPNIQSCMVEVASDMDIQRMSIASAELR